MYDGAECCVLVILRFLTNLKFKVKSKKFALFNLLPITFLLIIAGGGMDVE